MILLLTMHNSAVIDISNRNKSEVNLYYNATKGGVDILDQKYQAFSSKQKTRRQPKAHFYNLLDVCRIATAVSWIKLDPHWKKNKLNFRRKLFLKNVETFHISLNVVLPQFTKQYETILRIRLMKMWLWDNQMSGDTVTFVDQSKDELQNKFETLVKILYATNIHRKWYVLRIAINVLLINLSFFVIFVCFDFE